MYIESGNAMSAVLSLAMGYLIGCISPSAWIAKKKNVDLTKDVTQNLGATNTAYVLGKKAGIFVMIFDIAKSFFSYKLAKVLFPQLAVAGILACIGTILGHCFPFNMGFHGGKGLAAFGGLILAYSPCMFLIIITVGIILMFVFDTGVIAPFMGVVMFPVMVYYSGHDGLETLVVVLASGIIFLTHLSNFKMAKQKKDVVKTKEFMTKVFGTKNKTE